MELEDCNEEILNDLEALKTAMLTAADEAGATVMGESFHRFAPHGISGVVVVAESHPYLARIRLCRCRHLHLRYHRSSRESGRDTCGEARRQDAFHTGNTEGNAGNGACRVRIGLWIATPINGSGTE